jgi:signal transduction histidine kinase
MKSSVFDPTAGASGPAVPAGLVVFDAASCCCQVNDWAAALMGEAPVSLLGRTLVQLLGDLVTSDAAAELHAQAQATLASGTPWLRRAMRLGRRAGGTDPPAVPAGPAAIDCQTVRLPSEHPGGPPRVMLLMVPSAGAQATPPAGATAPAQGPPGLEQQLLGVLGHELRDPLHAIGLWSASLLRAEQLSPTARQRLACMQRVAGRASRVVRDFLDLAQARQGGGVPLAPSRIELGEVVDQAMNEAQALFPERAIKHERAPGLSGRWDADRLTQVVLNLLTNALKFSPADSDVAVKIWGEGRWACLRVHNLGRPIARAELARLFAPWHTSGAAGHGGRGLGLYIVDQLVRAQQGELTVVSDDERGTSFTVRLPRQADPAGSAAADRRPRGAPLGSAAAVPGNLLV